MNDEQDSSPVKCIKSRYGDGLPESLHEYESKNDVISFSKYAVPLRLDQLRALLWLMIVTLCFTYFGQ